MTVSPGASLACLLVGVSIGMERGCQQNDRTLADGVAGPQQVGLRHLGAADGADHTGQRLSQQRRGVSGSSWATGGRNLPSPSHATLITSLSTYLAANSRKARLTFSIGAAAAMPDASAAFLKMMEYRLCADANLALSQPRRLSGNGTAQQGCAYVCLRGTTGPPPPRGS